MSTAERLAEQTRRVILVGRTGFDQALRAEGSAELVRASDTFDALGELYMHSELPTTVIIAPDAEPTGEGECAAFQSAMRVVDAGVRLVRVGAMQSGYDDAVWPADEIGEVLEAIVGVTPDDGATVTDDTTTDTDDDAPDATPEHALPGHAAPGHAAPRRSAPARAPSSGPADDRAVLRAVLAGLDPTATAVGVVSARLGRACSFVPADGTTTGVPGPVAAEVRHGPLVLGHLVAELSGAAHEAGASEALRGALAEQAEWLGLWLGMDIQQRELRTAALTDPLTGVWNRRYFDRFLAATIERARDLRQPVTLMVFDIDDFKSYNDRHGHGAGDEILIEAAKLMRSVIRPTDRVCRIGGDEFAVIFFEPAGPRSPTSKPPESISGIARRFQKQICQHRFPKLGGQALATLTISGGLATYPWDGQSAAELLARADGLSLKSKQQGKNALTFGPGAERVCHPL